VLRYLRVAHIVVQIPPTAKNVAKMPKTVLGTSTDTVSELNYICFRNDCEISTYLLSVLGISYCVNFEKLGKMEGNGSVRFPGRAIIGELWVNGYLSCSYCSLAGLTGPCIAQESSGEHDCVSVDRSPFQCG
jgi:hypothetical protein